MTPTIKPNPKQHEAWRLLQDSSTRFLLFGGGANGGKSWLGCEWLLVSCYMYPGTRWFIGREELSRLKDSTLITFFKVCKHHNIPQDDYKFNGQSNSIIFKNGSVIDLLDLKFLPSDPLYERYGSVEYTSGWIEEAGEVHFGAFDTLKSRIGRFRNDEYELFPKLLVTCNPKKNWLYPIFYRPWKEKKLPVGYAFVQSLVDDNTFAESGSKEVLQSITDNTKRARLLHGNWEYDDNPFILIPFNHITDLWSNVSEESDKLYISGDLARLGGDKIVLYLWQGLKLKKIFVRQKQKTTETAAWIREVAREHRVPFSRIILDEDGVGGGVVDILQGVNGFLNGSSPLPNKRTNKSDNYRNLRSQCYYLLAEKVNDHLIEVVPNDAVFVTELQEELATIQPKDPEADEKPLCIIAKEDIKELINRSPDWADCMMMRMWFILLEEKPIILSEEEKFDRAFKEKMRQKKGKNSFFKMA